MAQWNTNVKHEPSSINNGNKYEIKDRPTREQLNALAENSFYAMNKSDDAVSKSEQAVETANEAFEQSKVTGTQIYSDGEFQKTFNMKQATADFAESERQKSLGEDGAIVHEKEVDNLKGEVLWENGSPYDTFASQTVTLSQSLANFKYVEVQYLNWKSSSSNIQTTGKLIKFNGGVLMYCSGGQYQTSVSRVFTYLTDTTIKFEATGQYDAGEGIYRTNDDLLIPNRIIGYKE